MNSSTEVFNPIREAMKNLPGNWFQGGYNGAIGQHCGLGHVRELYLIDLPNGIRRLDKTRVKEMHDAWELMHTVAQEQYNSDFVYFNDYIAKSEDEVLAVMDKAAVRWDETYGE